MLLLLRLVGFVVVCLVGSLEVCLVRCLFAANDDDLDESLLSKRLLYEYLYLAVVVCWLAILHTSFVRVLLRL